VAGVKRTRNVVAAAAGSKGSRWTWQQALPNTYLGDMRDDRTMRDNSVQSVHRAISILQVLAIHGAVGVTEIAVELSVHKSTVFRLLATLEARGLVEQNGERGRYRLAYGVVQLATGATKMDDLSLLSRPICRQLAETVRETVNVVVHDGRAVISIDQVLGAPAVTTVNWVGQRTPMHATSAGKVFMAHMDPEQLDALLEEGLETYTPHTIVDPVAVKRELALIRERGYAYTMDEHEIGLAAIGAPIRTLDGHVIAAVTASGPTFRMNEDTIPGLAEHVLSAAAEISQRHGYPRRG
jgi:IclR family transcriptional regulator, acetate operon repressor